MQDFKTSDFDYYLPEKYIAQAPIEPRDASRLLVLNRKTKEIRHAIFKEVRKFLRPNDLLVLNETRVIPARLFGKKAISGGKVEILLLRQIEKNIWEAIVGGKGLKEGKKIVLSHGIEVEILEVKEGPKRIIKFNQPLELKNLAEIGQIPLPPYIHSKLDDSERYQTVFAKTPGSAAAPTAGLHFTMQLIEDLKEIGIRFVNVTLHVGLDTFLPVKEETPYEHQIHSEWCKLSTESAKIINQVHQEGGRIIAVGTTSVRTLETAAINADKDKIVAPFEGSTNLYILPGYKFKVVDALITNFHLPKSTLIMLVSAFAGKDLIMHTYNVAIKEGYRFYSFGDAMFIE